MLFGLNKKTKKEDDNPEGVGSNAYQSIADSLYRQNIEINSKNKSLSISRKLYEISILTLGPGVLAEKICKVLQEELSFELVGILLIDPKESIFKPLSFVSSKRLLNIQSDLNINFNDVLINTSDSHIVDEVFNNRVSLNADDLSDIWGTNLDRKDYKKLEEEGHIKTTIISPLVIENKVMGISVFSMNREYNDLSDHEIESIANFNNVIAVAVDRSLLYKQLTFTNEKLEKANDRLKVLDKQKTEFVSLASHQLRGPLTAINGYVSLLVGGDYGKLTKKVSDALSKVQIAAKDLSLLVGDYLDVTRIELGKMKYDFEDLSLTEMAIEVVDEMRPVVEKHKLKLKVDLSDNRLLINADRNKLKQVMLNLVDNAVKYTQKGSITIKTSENNGKGVFSVIDTGMGVPGETLPTLFEKFVRAPDAHKVNVGGAGLGLFVARRIIDEHKGRIWAESDGLGKGSTFSFEVDLI